MAPSILTGIVLAVALAAAPNAAEAAPNADGLKAVEAHWLQAFTHGDTAFLQMLLTDDYVSVNAKGVARDRATIIKLAQSFAAKPPSSMPPSAPSTYAVAGNTGIVTSVGGGQRSVDVFYYADGQWHAWYSQHTTIVP